MSERLRLTRQGNDYWMLWDGDTHIGTVFVRNDRLIFNLDHDVVAVDTYGTSTPVLADIDMADTEPCDACGMPVWQDDEGDWNHVITDNGEPVALTLACGA